MTDAPLRCHLLIGPPGSGKTTLARELAPLLRGACGEPGLVLSTDVLRAELFGDAAVQGPWDEIRELLLQRLREAVARGTPVVIDATHARRPWRLLYTQALALPRPVEWIGWWLTTPLPSCLEWARRRERPVPEPVICEYHAAIGHRQFGPSRAEGFAAIVTLNPAAAEAEPANLRRFLAKLDGQIRNAVNRDQGKLPHLHRYARLLDLERLLFLLRLLSSFSGLEPDDPATAASLAAICTPPPSGDLAERAAAYLSRWSEVHGGSIEVYSDAAALRADLAWLEANGFTSLHWSSDEPIDPGRPAAGSAAAATQAGSEAGDARMRGGAGGGVNGGYPALADARVFRRVFTLLRHILKEPFDTPATTQPAAAAEGPDAAPADGVGGQRLYRHLIARCSHLEGSYRSDQEAVLRNDLRHLLRPYGFAPEIRGRPDSQRQGYAIGTALLSADQLRDLHALLKASTERLNDASQRPLLQALEERLRRAGVPGLEAAGPRVLSRRALPQRTFTEERSGTLAARDPSERIERAIQQRRRVLLRHRPDPGAAAGAAGDRAPLRVWPLQLLFHNISWYLAFETDAIGTPEGLIRILRADRLQLLGHDGAVRRSRESQHERALARLEWLLHICGGLWLGSSLEAQLAVMPQGRSAPAGREWYGTLRFSCTPRVFALIREEPHRFPPEHTAYSRPLPGLASGPEGPRDTLAPNPPGDSHPFPVELQLPLWTLEEDWDLRTWLFRWGDGVRIEQPASLRALHHDQARAVGRLYGD